MNTAILKLDVLVANYPVEYIFAMSGSFQALIQKIAIAPDELQLRLDYIFCKLNVSTRAEMVARCQMPQI
ncbi:hypothetical protein CEN50_15585 [Fischerella thermalis CCMEE 5268]|uniref:Uncharacterized protein n=1 Tax=Fischerella thermalis CCMEE 5268 TaxID=2019662 RepID=A0A2N6KED5_9CYAN|nr:hypothetical protein [Fischerella thermalis]PLZ97351.1 hypothetical protein CEN50_15585 [Fischerella thermalis CCMEE 5268]